MTVVIYPTQQAPSLSLPTVGGETFELAKSNPEKFTIVIFYRGLHCPICIDYLVDVEKKYQSAKEAGFEIVAVSMDDKDRATQFCEKVGAKLETPADTLKVPIAYGLTEEQARAWGLYMSDKIEGTTELEFFNEPGLFVIKPDNSVFMVQVQSAPFTRPNTEQMISWLEYAHENNYPVRGTRKEDKAE